MFKNQYILTEKEITVSNNWSETPFSSFHLYFDTNLDYCKSTNEQKTVILLGYAFHAYDKIEEQNLTQRVLALNEDELLDEIDCWCGHFVLFVSSNIVKIYNDACASFKVFYGENSNGKAVGSDPKILTHYLNFKEDTNHEKLKFYQSEFFNKNRIKVGHETRFENMHQLVANHCLNIENMQSVRVFPRKKRIEISEKQASKELVPIFKNILNQIEKRHTIYCSLTAGYDSRLLMAATKKYAKNIIYYTFKFPNKKEDYIDYKIPKKITGTLNLEYILSPLKDKLPQSELEDIVSSYDFPRTILFLQYFESFTENEKPNILLTGGGSEVAKNYLEDITVKNGKDVVRAIHFPDNIYLFNYYQNWLNNNSKSIQKTGYTILDIVHWEQDITSFAGQNMHYAHHYTKIASIFNCTKVLELMLAVNKKERDAKAPKFYKFLIDEMWQELNNFPYNPSWKEFFIKLLKNIGVYKMYKFLLIKLKTNG